MQTKVIYCTTTEWLELHATGWLGNWKSREQEWEWESGNKHWADWSEVSVCILTKLLSLAYCLFTKHPSVGTLPHAAVTDTLAKISYTAIHWREHRHSHSCSVSHSLAAFPEWLTSELLKFQHNCPSLVCSFVCIWEFIWPWFLMLIKRYLAYFQCGAYNFRYVFEQHPVSQDSHIDGCYSTQQTQCCSHLCWEWV